MVVEVTDTNFADIVAKSEQVVMVDFWAAWCGPCKMIAPIVEQLADEYKGKAVIGKCDVDANAAVASEHAIRSIPSILFFKQGKLIETHVGAASKGVLEDKLKAYL